MTTNQFQFPIDMARSDAMDILSLIEHDSDVLFAVRTGEVDYNDPEQAELAYEVVAKLGNLSACGLLAWDHASDADIVRQLGEIADELTDKQLAARFGRYPTE